MQWRKSRLEEVARGSKWEKQHSSVQRLKEGGVGGGEDSTRGVRCRDGAEGLLHPEGLVWPVCAGVRSGRYGHSKAERVEFCMRVHLSLSVLDDKNQFA